MGDKYDFIQNENDIILSFAKQKYNYDIVVADYFRTGCYYSQELSIELASLLGKDYRLAEINDILKYEYVFQDYQKKAPLSMRINYSSESNIRGEMREISIDNYNIMYPYIVKIYHNDIYNKNKYKAISKTSDQEFSYVVRNSAG